MFIFSDKSEPSCKSILTSIKNIGAALCGRPNQGNHTGLPLRYPAFRIPKSVLRLCVFFPELFDAAFGIDELLFAGEEGVADRADVEPDTVFSGSGRVCFAAGAVDRRQLIV